MLTRYLTNHILQDLQKGKLLKSDALELFEHLESQDVNEEQIYQELEKKRIAVHQDVHLAKEREVTKETKEGISFEPVLREKLKVDLSREIRDILGMDYKTLDTGLKLTEHGFNSITLTELATRINLKFGVELTPTLFFEYPTLEALVRFLAVGYYEGLLQHYNITDLREQTSPSSAPVASTPLPQNGSSISSKSAPRKEDPIAIVGISGMMPGAAELDDFWKKLEANEDLIEEIPAERWDWRDYYGDPKTESNKTRAKYGGFIQDADKFDPLFFKISPREAELMDPQHRLLLQNVWQAIEDSGTNPEELAGSRTGLYMGVGAFDYLEVLKEAGVQLHPQLITGNVASFLTNRISYLLDLHGPSEPINTACSASLVAIHHAVEAIRRGDCDMALAGGVHLTLTPAGSLVFSRSGMLNEDGKCKAFDKDADGYVRGEGVGVVFLKPLSLALRDKNPIYGLVRGSAENHGGQAESMTAPNPASQKQLLVDAYRRAHVDPRNVGYIEAHGTGTRLGDPIEMQGLKSAFRELYGEIPATTQLIDETHIAVGSVKTNVGHLETAAGIAGVLKVLLMLKHKTIPGNPHLKEVNPYIDLKGSPFYMPKATREWFSPLDLDGQVLPRMAGVSSFGIGGSNSHIILEEYIPEPEENQGTQASPVLIPLSARNPERLNEVMGGLLGFLGEPGTAAESPAKSQEQPCRSQENLLGTLKGIMASLLNVPEDEIEPEQAFIDYGMEQIQLNEIRLQLQTNLEEKIDYNTFQNCANPIEVVEMLEPECSSVAETKPVLESNTLKDDLNLTELAYTLQVGRKEMEERVYFVVSDIAELASKLRTELQNREAPGKSGAEDSQLFQVISQDADVLEAMNQTVRKWAAQGNLEKIGEYWRKGLAINWESLYGNNHPARLSLPAYPFEKKRCWVETEGGEISTDGKSGKIARLHPLLHRNISDLNEQKFISEFSGEEFFIADHKIHDEAVFSSSAPLEMARFGGELASGEKIKGIKKLRWKNAIMGDTSPVIATTAFFYDESELNFEVRREDGLVSCQGVLETGTYNTGEIPARLSLADISSRCSSKIGKNTIYDEFSAQDVFLGEGLRVLKELRYNEGEALTELRIPENILADRERYGLHPSLLDGTIQSVIRYEMENRGWLLSVILPSTLERVSIYGELSPLMYAHVSHLAEEKDPESGLKLMKYDVSLVNAAGDVAVKVSGFTVKILAGEGNQFDLSASLLGAATAAPTSLAVSETEGEQTDGLFQKVQQELLEKVSQVLKMEAADIRAENQISELGVQSIILMELTDSINKSFGIQVAPTLFFEYTTVEALTGHFLDVYGPLLEKKFALKAKDTTPAPVVTPTENVPPQTSRTKTRFRSGEATPATSPALPASPAIPAVKAADVKKEDIAVVGISGRLPGGPDMDTFWENIAGNKDLIQEIPADRWDWREYYGDHKTQPNKTKAKWGGFIDDVDTFDYSFFNYSPREAELIDPQHRLFLQSVWEALEDSGTAPSSLSGSDTGLFVGGGAMDYLEIVREAEEGMQAQMVTGNVTTFLANRVSYLLNLRGPSEPVETACSASLIAVHRAVESIRNGECSTAIAGGVNFILTPTITLAFSTMGIISEDGRCRVFDKSANGYVRGEGVGAVYLKPLSQAIKDGNPIYGLIKGGGENHGGRANSMTAPSPIAQKELLLKTYKRANVDPRTLGYLEAHGTGTELGDPIEMNALKSAFAEIAATSESPVQKEEGYLGVGSVKTNIGHLETAAGISGVLKVLLMLKNKTIPGNPHLKEQNPYIDLKQTPFYLVEETREWTPLKSKKGETLPRRAGVSSFGAGGSNAHVIIEEYLPEGESSTPAYKTGGPALIPVSAKTPERLNVYVKSLLEALENKEAEIGLYELAYTFQKGRDEMECRVAFASETLEELIQRMKLFLLGESSAPGVYTGEKQEKVRPLTAQETLGYLEKLELDSIGEAWVRGQTVDWDVFYPDGTPAKLNLPTYPFAKNRCWVEQKTKKPMGAPVASTLPAVRSSASVRESLLELLYQTTKTPVEELKDELLLRKLGVDSIMMLSLVGKIENLYTVGLTISDTFEMKVGDLIRFVEERAEAPGEKAPVNADVSVEPGGEPLTPEYLRKHPELQILQKGGALSPAHWFYSGFGTIQPYIPLSQALGKDLPFYGFQASGVKGEKKDFKTLEEIAAYQAGIMTKIQPEGEFQLGGYSFGGVLAYETARQLQERGRVVKNIIMLDSFYPGNDFPAISYRSSTIMTFMSFMGMNGMEVGELYTRNVDDDELFDYLVNLGLKRGLKYTRAEFVALFEKYMNLVDDSMLDAYSPKPLLDSGVALEFFSRKDSEYFIYTGDGEYNNADLIKNISGRELERINSAFAEHSPEEWSQLMPNMQVHRTDAEDHFRMLANPGSVNMVVEALKTIYGA